MCRGSTLKEFEKVLILPVKVSNLETSKVKLTRFYLSRISFEIYQMRKNDYNDYLYESVTKICKKIKME